MCHPLICVQETSLLKYSDILIKTFHVQFTCSVQYLKPNFQLSNFISMLRRVMSCFECHVNAAFRDKGNEPQFQNGTHKNKCCLKFM